MSTSVDALISVKKKSKKYPLVRGLQYYQAGRNPWLLYHLALLCHLQSKHTRRCMSSRKIYMFGLLDYSLHHFRFAMLSNLSSHHSGPLIFLAASYEPISLFPFNSQYSSATLSFSLTSVCDPASSHLHLILARQRSSSKSTHASSLPPSASRRRYVA